MDLALSFVTAMVVFVIVSFVADKTRRYAVIGVIGVVIAAVSLVIAGTTSHALLAAPLVAIGFGTAQTPVLMAPSMLQQYYAGADVQGAAAGVMTGVGNLLSGFAPLIVGILVGMQHGSFVWAFTFLGIVIAVGAVCFALLVPDEIRRVRAADTVRMTTGGFSQTGA